MGFGDVLADLASIGFDAEWQVIPAASVGAPHKRDRVFIVAYPNNSGSRTPKRRIDDNGSAQIKKRSNIAQSKSCGFGANVANTDNRRQQKRNAQIGVVSIVSTSGKRNRTEMAHTDGEQLGQRGRTKDIGSKNRVWSDHIRRETTNGFRQWWKVEPDVGRVANGVSDRVDRLKGLGNAIVPQVAELVGALVVEHSQN